MVSKLTDTELTETSKTLESYASHYALLAKYLATRALGVKHERAKRVANTTRRLLRRNFGYQSTADINF